MTKKDYIAIAKAIKDNTYPSSKIAIEAVKPTKALLIDKEGLFEGIAAYLLQDNPQFDIGKFWDACC